MVRVSVTAAIVIAVICAILFSPLLKIKNVEFGAQQNCIRDQKQLEKYQVIGQNILLFKSADLAQNLKNDFSCIDQITIKKQFPRALKIDISSQRAVAKIEGANLVITKNGDVSQSADFANLPTIFLPPNVKVSTGQKVTDQVSLFALEVAAQLQKTDFTPQNVRILETSDVAVYDSHGVTALFSGSRPASAQVDSLQAILGKAKIDETKIAKIDLRFDKPVIVNKQ